MKKLVLAAALAVSANAALASGLSEPIVMPEVIIQEAATSSMSQAILPPLLGLIMLAVLMN